MKFKSYTDIENSYNKKFINQIREYKFDSPEIEWVAEIKIDGSNFQCCLDCNDEFIVGTRTRFLGRGSDFQGYERALRNEHVQDCLLKMKSWIKENYSNVFEQVKDNNFVLRVYGELCGGMYRHPDVEKVKGAVKIQGRVNYHPDNVWIPFDIELADKDDNIIFVFSQTGVYSLCELVGLPTPIIIKKGTFDELINLPNDFNDPTGHILFGLPKIENNITEGLVIKPNEPLRFGNGSRVMVKSKNDKFKEKSKKEPKEPKEIIPMNELELKYFELYREFITESRVMSVISKVGKVNTKAFGMILGMFIKDLYNDFDKEYGDEIKKFEDTLPVDEFNLAKAKKEIAKEAIEFIRPIFLEYLNE
jgi:Rnl2 family RNA ligase